MIESEEGMGMHVRTAERSGARYYLGKLGAINNDEIDRVSLDWHQECENCSGRQREQEARIKLAEAREEAILRLEAQLVCVTREGKARERDTCQVQCKLDGLRSAQENQLQLERNICSKKCRQCLKIQVLPEYARLPSQKDPQQDFELEVGSSERAANAYNRDKMYKALHDADDLDGVVRALEEVEIK